MVVATTNQETEVSLLLKVPRADIDEITQPEGAPPNIGSRRTVVHGTELLVLELVFTEDQLKEAAGQLSVDPSVLAAAPGEPIVVLVCGEYRVPLLANVAVRRSTPHNYVFYLPNLPIGVNLDPSTESEVAELFHTIVTGAATGVAATGVGPNDDPNTSTGASSSADSDDRVRAAAAADEAAEASANQQDDAHPAVDDDSPAATSSSSPGTWSTSIATRLESSSANVSRVLLGSATHVGNGLRWCSQRLISRTQPRATPVHVGVASKQRAASVRRVTTQAVRVSSQFTAHIARAVAHVSGSRRDAAAKQQRRGSAGTVFAAMFNATLVTVGSAGTALKIVLSAGSEGVSDVIRHKYGDDVADVVGDSAGAATDLVTAAYVVQQAPVNGVVHGAATTVLTPEELGAVAERTRAPGEAPTAGVADDAPTAEACVDAATDVLD